MAEPVKSFVTILAAVAALNYTGVCGRQLKWMSADDYKAAAVGFFFDSDLKDRYSSVEEFLKKKSGLLCSLQIFRAQLRQSDLGSGLFLPRQCQGSVR